MKESNKRQSMVSLLEKEALDIDSFRQCPFPHTGEDYDVATSSKNSDPTLVLRVQIIVDVDISSVGILGSSLKGRYRLTNNWGPDQVQIEFSKACYTCTVEENSVECKI